MKHARKGVSSAAPSRDVATLQSLQLVRDSIYELVFARSDALVRALVDVGETIPASGEWRVQDANRIVLELDVNGERQPPLRGREDIGDHYQQRVSLLARTAEDDAAAWSTYATIARFVAAFAPAHEPTEASSVEEAILHGSGSGASLELTSAGALTLNWYVGAGDDDTEFDSGQTEVRTAGLLALRLVANRLRDHGGASPPAIAANFKALARKFGVHVSERT